MSKSKETLEKELQELEKILDDFSLDWNLKHDNWRWYIENHDSKEYRKVDIKYRKYLDKYIKTIDTINSDKK